MEFGAKEIIIALGLVVLIAIILEVVKRMRSSRYENIRMPRKKRPSFDDDDFDEFGSELPSGGARVVGYRDATDNDASDVKAAPNGSAKQPVTDTDVSVAPTPAPKPVKAPPPSIDTPQASLDLGLEPAHEPLVIVLHLMAQNGIQFEGEKLKNALLESGLRYGSMKIFHRHTNESGSGPVIFSVANSVNPGIFDLDGMASFSTPGVTFLFAVDDTDQPYESFDILLSTAQHLAATLDGELKDETRSDLTRQTIEHCRQKITDHMRSKRTGSL